jgi:hypothetical protein
LNLRRRWLENAALQSENETYSHESHTTSDHNDAGEF